MKIFSFFSFDKITVEEITYLFPLTIYLDWNLNSEYHDI